MDERLAGQQSLQSRAVEPGEKRAIENLDGTASAPSCVRAVLRFLMLMRIGILLGDGRRCGLGERRKRFQRKPRTDGAVVCQRKACEDEQAPGAVSGHEGPSSIAMKK